MAPTIALDQHWWQRKRYDAHGAIAEIVNRLRRVLGRDSILKQQLNLLYNRTYNGLEPGSARYARNSLDDENKLIINTMGNLHQTIKAQVCVDRPKPQVMSSGGDWSTRRMAKKLDKAILGEYHRNKTYELAEQCVDDMLWADIGVMKVHGVDCVRHERVFPGEITVDEQACLTSPPRTLYQSRPVPAEVLMARYPNEKGQIKRSINQSLRSWGDRSVIVATDLVWVHEAYHLPSADGADDGRVVVCTEQGTLEDEPWTESEFPFAFIYWHKPPIGFFGVSFVEEQAPIQRQTNELFLKFQQAFDLNPQFRIFFEEGSINPHHLVNAPGGAISVSKTARRWPEVHTRGSVPSDAYEHAWRLIKTQHDNAGTSPMSASGQKPSGDMSGVALRTLQDVETRRHGLTVRAYQRFHIQIADLTVRAAKRIYKHNPEYSASYVGKRYVETIKWKDVEIDHYVMQLWPTNILPSTVEGKLARVQDLIAAQLIPPHMGRMLLDFPDIEGINFENAEMEYIDFLAEKLMDGERHPPAEYLTDNLHVAILRMARHAMIARMDGATADDIEPLTDWIADAVMERDRRRARMQAIAQQAQADMAPPPMPGGNGAAMAMGQGPPQPDMPPMPPDMPPMPNGA